MEMDIDDSFYDELSSFMSSPSDYSLNHHDFDEIIGSTVSQLDSTLDLNGIIPESRENSLLQAENLFSELFQTTPESQLDLELNLNNLSSNAYDPHSLSAFSAANSFNICNDNAEIEKLTCGNLFEHSPDRDTPSPTESCDSFSGSSTSGVHSDTSDAWQNKQSDLISIPSPASIQNVSQLSTIQFAQRNNSNDSIQKSSLQVSEKKSEFVPLAAPLCPVKVEAGLAAARPPKSPNRGKSVIIEPPAETVPKTKTIFLSSNDYKALMQKMNSNGSKGAKINGSVKAQIPKIVVKTANAKVHNYQNSVQQTTTNTISVNSPPNMHKNQPQISVSHPSGYISRGLIDEKMYKRQQRMIKNRESASLSRKKKKEYVVSLETRINKLEKENYTLKGENVTLRNQLVAFAKTCKCRKGSACEFVLHSLNSAQTARGAEQQQQHVKIAPKPTTKSFRQHMNAATVKKNVAVLFAMAFMVTLNAGNFQSYLSKQNLDADNVAVADTNAQETLTIGRRLLWVESEEEYNEKLNRSIRQAEEQVVPPLHFLKPISRSSSDSRSNAIKRDQWNSTAEGAGSKFKSRNDPPPLTYPTKAITISNGNQTEYSRLSINLEKLINVSGYLNLSMNTKFNIEQDNSHGFQFSTDYLDMERQASNLGKRKSFVGFNEMEHKQRKMDIKSNKNSFNNTNNEPPINLFKGIERQDDTYYVISFNTEHILLSPSTHNKSERPKLSLLLPTAEPTENGDMRMMQVDCEVFNTKELELKSQMIPAKLRPNVTKWHIKSPKHVANVHNKTQGSLKFQDRTVKHEKPRVRTYFMVGPKNQAAAAVSQEKPRLVEFNKSMVNSSSSSKLLKSDLDNRLNG